MPQLDQFTYLTQIIWLTGSFLGYYVVLYKYGLPKLSRIFKVRARLQSRSCVSPKMPAGVQSVSGGVAVSDNYDIVESIKVCANYLTAQISSAQIWSHDRVNQLNGESGSGLTLKGATKTYIHSLAEMRLSQNLQSKTLEKCGALFHSSFQLGSTPLCASKLRSIVLIRIRQYCGHKGVQGRPVSTKRTKGVVSDSVTGRVSASKKSVRVVKKKQVKNAR